MRKKRLIYTLIFDNGNFMLSRNFRLQKVGDYNWVNKNYNFQKIATSIDELVILNVTRGDKRQDLFINTIQQVIKHIFVPIAIGGGIKILSDANNMFLAGADKIIINTALFNDPELIKSIVNEYGSQAVIASIDFKIVENELRAFNENGTHLINMNFAEYIHYIQNLGIGEVYLNSIQKDGTGQGYDVETISPYLDSFSVPVIMAGGAGNVNHFLGIINNPHIEAVATANLFNFIGNALPEARMKMLENNVLLAKFQDIV